MHVADVTMFYAENGGGVRRYIEAKRAWLRKKAGCSHTLIVPKSRSAPAELQTIGLPSVRLPFAEGYRVPLGRAQAARALIALKPTLIEAGDPYTLAWAALKAGDDLGIPVVAFCHSDLPRLIGSFCGTGAERIAARYCLRLYRHFDLVLAPSRAMTARLASWGISCARHQPLGVDLDVFAPRRHASELQHRLGLTAATRILVYAGRFAPEKNLDVLVDAMRSLGSRYLCLLIGAGKTPRDLPGNVRAMPYIDDREALASLLAGCDAFVHPGDQETFGLAALEAMACAVPVVGVDAAGMAELVSTGAGMLVPPRNSDAFAEGITALFEADPRAMGLEARKIAERYAWPAVLAGLADRYAALGARTRH